MHLLRDLAAVVGGEVLGDAELEITGIRPLDVAEAGDLSFLHRASYRDRARASSAGALLVPRTERAAVADLERSLLLVDDSQRALALLIGHVYPRHRPAPGVHPTAVLAAGAVVGDGVHIGPYAVVGAGSRIGDRAVIEAHVVIGRHCSLGDDVHLHAHAVVYDGCRIGDRVEVHSGAVIGADGFGYATHRGVHHKVPQVGHVKLDNDVEVGANSTIDRAVLEATRVGAGSKIDNLVQVGHNVELGRGCILCGQAGLAGSSKYGDYVVFGGQAGATDHIEVASGVQVAAKSALFGSIDTAGQQVGGVPAIDIATWRRQVASIARGPRLGRRLRRLEKRLVELEQAASADDSFDEDD